MSGAGRGLNRVNPIGGSPAPFVNPADFENFKSIAVTPGPWGFIQRIVDGGLLALTDSYQDYNQAGLLRIPYGTVRLGIAVNYLPASVGGRLALGLRFVPPSGYGFSSNIIVPSVANTTAFAPIADPFTAEVAQYSESIVTPAGTNLSEQNYVLPFWIPPLLPITSPTLPEVTPYITLQVRVREASGISPEGSVSILALVSESFGAPFLYKGESP